MMALETPILFIVFKRFDTTKKVFQEIKKTKPKKLYIAADGPRNSLEKKRTNKVRNFILKNIDWKCNVKTLFREKNLGCGTAVSSAITWFFKNEEMGIILEDDCLPNQSFFTFCEQMLKKYKNNKKIMQVCGFNPVSKKVTSKESYYFGYFGSIWGWATWKRAWKKYDFDIKQFPYFKRKNKINEFDFDRKMKEERIKTFEFIYNKGLDTWDYQWDFIKLFNKSMSIVPSKNLVKNIGFGEDSTFNTGSGKRFEFIKREKIEFPLKHPEKVSQFKEFDKRYFYFFNRKLYVKVFDLIKIKLMELMK